MQLKSIIMQDERVKKTLKSLSMNLSYSDLENELMHIQASRPVRALKRGKLLSNAQIELLDCRLHETATRSRVTEIQMIIVTEKAEFSRRLSRLSRYIIAQHSGALSKHFKTITEKKDYIGILLSTYVEYVESLDTLYKLASLVLSDIDQSHWNVKSVEEILTNLATEKYR